MSDTDLGWPALAMLVPLAAVCGLATGWVMKRFSDRAEVDRTKRRIVAHLLEFRLFGEEPALVVRAQWEVARQCLRMVRLLLLPAVVVAAPMLVLFPFLEGVFGHAPVSRGQSTVITVRADGARAVRLVVGGGAVVETAEVRSGDEWSWRVRIRDSGDATLRVIGAGRFPSALVRRMRTGLVSGALARPGGIDVYYEPASILGVRWEVWFVIVSFVAFLLI
ncbi:MAG: hypothetical protein U0Q16_03040 [Bryobacteraceae bacterium]